MFVLLELIELRDSLLGHPGLLPGVLHQPVHHHDWSDIKGFQTERKWILYIFILYYYNILYYHTEHSEHMYILFSHSILNKQQEKFIVCDWPASQVLISTFNILWIFKLSRFTSKIKQNFTDTAQATYRTKNFFFFFFFFLYNITPPHKIHCRYTNIEYINFFHLLLTLLIQTRKMFLIKI